jgi:hypothetical protein
MRKPALWVQIRDRRRKKEAKPRRFIRAISEGRAERLKAYAKLKREFMRANARCQRPGCQKPAKDLHHKRGRHGELLTDARHWAALCRTCHNWVGEHPKEARALGLLCDVGDWGKVDR